MQLLRISHKPEETRQTQAAAAPAIHASQSGPSAPEGKEERPLWRLLVTSKQSSAARVCFRRVILGSHERPTNVQPPLSIPRPVPAALFLKSLRVSSVL